MSDLWHREKTPVSGPRCCVCGSPDWIGCEPGDEDGARPTAWCIKHHPLLKEIEC